MSSLTSHPVLEPEAVWDVQPWGTPAFRMADVNGDGQPEMLFLQTAGAHANKAFDPRVPGKHSYLTGPEDQDLFCMTLTDMQGRILWQQGKPWAMERPFSWNGTWDAFARVTDIDSDGVPEILFIHNGVLYVHSGATGELLRQREMPNTAFKCLKIIRTGRTTHPELFAKSGSESLTHSMGNPSIVMDHELNILWQQDEVPGAGHQGFVADVDGDGYDEFLIGFSLFDHDGTLLWQHQPLSKDDHLDDAVVADLRGDGNWTFALAHDGHEAVVHNVDGTERFRVPMDHCQTVQSAGLFADDGSEQLIFNDKAEGDGRRETAVFNAEGRELSRYTAPGYTSIVNWPTAHGPQSLIAMARPPEKDGYHAIYWMDPTGEVLAELKVRNSFRNLIETHLENVPGIRSNYWAYRGAMLTVAVGDLDDDGMDEVFATDRLNVWVFRQPDLR